MRTDPWETGFVDITGDQALLGQVDGRTSAAVQAWLAARTEAFRAGIEVVVIDPHAGYAAAVRAALPEARIAVDHFHLVMLANKAVTAVRQRVTRDLLDRRGRKTDPTWANRRLLLRGRERLSQAALARMWNGCVDHDPTGQILSAWIAKEELRALCATAARGGHRQRDPPAALGVLPVVRRRRDPRADHARGDDRDLVAGDRGVPDHRADERPDRGHEQVDQAGETRRLRVPEPGELPAPGTVALHPADPPIVSEEPDGARPKLKSRSGRARATWMLGADVDSPPLGRGATRGEVRSTPAFAPSRAAPRHAATARRGATAPDGARLSAGRHLVGVPGRPQPLHEHRPHRGRRCQRAGARRAAGRCRRARARALSPSITAVAA